MQLVFIITGFYWKCIVLTDQRVTRKETMQSQLKMHLPDFSSDNKSIIDCWFWRSLYNNVFNLTTSWKENLWDFSSWPLFYVWDTFRKERSCPVHKPLMKDQESVQKMFWYLPSIPTFFYLSQGLKYCNRPQQNDQC